MVNTPVADTVTTVAHTPEEMAPVPIAAVPLATFTVGDVAPELTIQFVPFDTAKTVVADAHPLPVLVIVAPKFVVAESHTHVFVPAGTVLAPGRVENKTVVGITNPLALVHTTSAAEPPVLSSLKWHVTVLLMMPDRVGPAVSPVGQVTVWFVPPSTNMKSNCWNGVQLLVCANVKVTFPVRATLDGVLQPSIVPAVAAVAELQVRAVVPVVAKV